MTGRTQHHETARGEPSAHDTGAAVGDDALAVRLGELARSLQELDDPDEVLAAVVRSALELVPGVEEGSVSLVTGRRHVRALASSGPLPTRVDALQSETGQGPCLEAVREHVTVRVPDMAAEARWPRFAQRAAEAGAASMLSVQLYVEEADLGALNLYARRPGAFTDASEHVGLLLATHAAIAYEGVRAKAQLSLAMSSREVIGRATGILMERHRMSAEQAFAALTTASQETNAKLREVAEELTRTGELPGRGA